MAQLVRRGKYQAVKGAFGRAVGQVPYGVITGKGYDSSATGGELTDER